MVSEQPWGSPWVAFWDDLHPGQAASSFLLLGRSSYSCSYMDRAGFLPRSWLSAEPRVAFCWQNGSFFPFCGSLGVARPICPQLRLKAAEDHRSHPLGARAPLSHLAFPLGAAGPPPCPPPSPSHSLTALGTCPPAARLAPSPPEGTYRCPWPAPACSQTPGWCTPGPAPRYNRPSPCLSGLWKGALSSANTGQIVPIPLSEAIGPTASLCLHCVPYLLSFISNISLKGFAEPQGLYSSEGWRQGLIFNHLTHC